MSAVLAEFGFELNGRFAGLAEHDRAVGTASRVNPIAQNL